MNWLDTHKDAKEIKKIENVIAYDVKNVNF